MSSRETGRGGRALLAEGEKRERRSEKMTMNVRKRPNCLFIFVQMRPNAERQRNVKIKTQNCMNNNFR